VDAGQELLDQAQDLLSDLPHQRQIGPRELDQLGVGDVLGEEAGVLDGDEVRVAAVQDQGGRMDQRQDGPGVDFQRGVQQRLGCPRAGPGALQLGEPAQNRSSPARLGIRIPARASLPHSWSTWPRRVWVTSAGTPMG
jgi:hypothetical protein